MGKAIAKAPNPVKRVGKDLQSLMVNRLEDTYKGSKAALNYDTVFQLLIAVILSAQTNDNQVNKITEKLFFDYPDAPALSKLSQEELEQAIKTCGLYKNKAKNIIAASKCILTDFKGEVPTTRKELMSLPGVGRKTANVVLSVGLGQPALAVDTHVFRVSRRLGLAYASTPEGVEADLCELIPAEKWGDAHHWLIWHGRRVCAAQKPKCSICPLQELCPSCLNQGH